MSEVTPSGPWFRKNSCWLLAVGAAIVSVIFSWLSRDYYPLFGFNDDANYYLNALDILAGVKESNSQLLPGQSLLLALWQKLFGANFTMFQAGALLVNIMAAVFIYLTVRDARDGRSAAFATCFFLLTPGVVLHSTTLVSDVLFGLQMWSALYFIQLSWRREGAGSFALIGLAGLLLGWAICTRSQGYFLAGGLGLAHLYFRRFKALGVLFVGAVVGVTVLFSLAQNSFQSYGTQALATMNLSPTYFYEWGLGMVALWSDYLFELPLLGAPAPISHLLVGIVILLGLVGFASRLRKLHLLEIVGFCYFGGHVLWCFQFARYWLTFWPLLGLFLWDAYVFSQERSSNKRLSSSVLAGLMALMALCVAVDTSAVGYARLHAQQYQQRLELYRACQDIVPEKSLLATRFSAQARILARRDAVQLPPGSRFAEIVWWLVNSPVEYVLVDRSSEPIVGVGGVANVTYVPGFEYRLEASQLFQQRYVDKWGSVYQLTVDKEDYRDAFNLFVEAERLASQGETQRALTAVELSLQQVEDLVEARFLRASLLNELGHPGALDDIERLLEQNPAYPELTMGLGQMLGAYGQVEKARRHYERAMKVARVQGDFRTAEAARAFLEGLPPAQP